jgi:hypothetical protein
MKRPLLIAVFGAVIVACAAPAHAAICAPKKLVHAVIAEITPDIPSSSFAAQPKEFYRIGSDRLRTEEAADPGNGIHGVIVVSEPDIWMANLYDGSGKHIVDPGPTYFARAPVFGQLLPGKLASLEIGCEPAFIAEFAPNPVRQEQVGSARYDVYRVQDGIDAVELLELPGSKAPSFARYFRNGKLVIALRYDLYAADLAENPQLFVRPAGIKYEEMKQN